MIEKISLKEAERKVFSLTYQDGLWDMMMGLTILSVTISGVLRYNPLPVPWNYFPVAVVLLLVFPGFNFAKRKITVPRIGLVEFGEQRKKRLRLVRGVMMGLAFFTMVLFFMTAFSPFKISLGNMPSWTVDAFVGLLVGLLFSYIANVIGQSRVYLYGWLLAVALPLDVILDPSDKLNGPYAQMFVGALMLVFGIVLLSRFLRQYPLDLMEA
jgi:hypothetical protein